MKEQITYDIFDKVDIRLGTVLSVKKNEKARKPSLVAEDCLIPISLPKSTSTIREGFLAFSFFFTLKTVPNLISTLSKMS